MKLLLIAFTGLISLLSIASANIPHDEKNAKNKITVAVDYYDRFVRNLYTQCDLQDNLDYSVFKQALAGYKSLELSNKRILSIIDFSKPSTEERFFIIDVKNYKLLYQTLVAHGKNSGYLNATKFSNRMGSHKSSLGFYRTGTSYFGKRGYSLQLEGLEKGINDNARLRGIVIHGANYVNEEYTNGNNMIGRSWGCPAVSKKLNKEIIDLLKGGSCLFIYAEDETYQQGSKYTTLNEDTGANNS